MLFEDQIVGKINAKPLKPSDAREIQYCQAHTHGEHAVGGSEQYNEVNPKEI
jgi:hypothetical protein